MFYVMVMLGILFGSYGLSWMICSTIGIPCNFSDIQVFIDLTLLLVPFALGGAVLVGLLRDAYIDVEGKTVFSLVLVGSLAGYYFLQTGAVVRDYSRMQYINDLWGDKGIRVVRHVNPDERPETIRFQIDQVHYQDWLEINRDRFFEEYLQQKEAR